MLRVVPERGEATRFSLWACRLDAAMRSLWLIGRGQTTEEPKESGTGRRVQTEFETLEESSDGSRE